MTCLLAETFASRGSDRSVAQSWRILDDYVPVIGLNSTGKSNVLRALNLFFNGVLDEDRTPPSVDRDHPKTSSPAGAGRGDPASR